jgi:hypothetical protein
MFKEILSTVSQRTELFPSLNELRARFFALFLMATPDAKCLSYLRNRPPCEEVKDDRVKNIIEILDDYKFACREPENNSPYDNHYICKKKNPSRLDDEEAFQRLLERISAGIAEDAKDFQDDK